MSEGFEPSNPFLDCPLRRRVHSATLPTRHMAAYSVYTMVRQVYLCQSDRPRASRPRGVARKTAREQGTDCRRHLCARPQYPSQMAKAICSASQASCPARPRQVHAEAGQGRFGGERCSLLRDACGGSVWVSIGVAVWAAEPGRNLSPRRLGETVARRCSHGGLHDFARCASSRSGGYAGPSAWISIVGRGCPWDLALGKTMEGVRIYASAIRIVLLAGSQDGTTASGMSNGKLVNEGTDPLLGSSKILQSRGRKCISTILSFIR
jgi:hypothetical protein